MHSAIDRWTVWVGLAGLATTGTIASCNGQIVLSFDRPGGDGGADGGSSVATTLDETCSANPAWIPLDGGAPPAVTMADPAPHPDTECAFYAGVYQNFLIATPDGSGDPDLVSYATIEDVFQSAFASAFLRNSGQSDPAKSPDPCVNPGGATAAAQARSGPPTGKAWLGNVGQPGYRNVLIDQDGHPIYYGIHVNQAFVDFVVANGLQTPAGILAADPTLQFPPGIVELKTAWKDIDPRDFPDAIGNLCDPAAPVRPPTDFASDPGDYSNYITTMAWIPWLTTDPTSGAIDEDRDHPVLRKVALVTVESVHTLPGHPEFVWGSVQHVNVNEVDPSVRALAGVSVQGMPDTQPDSIGPDMLPALPDPNDPQNVTLTSPPSSHRYLLYAPDTLERAANSPLADSELAFDASSQSFGTSPTSAYRTFPGSSSTERGPRPAVYSLNASIGGVFQSAIASHALDPARDKRQNYRLVGAIWLDKPAFFGLGTQDPSTGQYPGETLQNDDGTNPLVLGAMENPPDVFPSVSEGVTCGTPTGTNGHPPTSGDLPGATSLDNTVPGCETRADELNLPDAGNPPPETDSGPGAAFDSHIAGTESPFSILGGQDRLSSPSLETFTQHNEFHDCFACHNTMPSNDDGVPADPQCLSAPSACVPHTTIPFAAEINVSHMFSEFLIRERAAAIKAGVDAGL